MVVTTNEVADGEVLEEVLAQVKYEIAQVSSDGAYDHRHCYDEIDARRAKAVIPPVKLPKSGSTEIAMTSPINVTRTSA